MTSDHKIFKNEQEISTRIKDLGSEITQYYKEVFEKEKLDAQEKSLITVSILKGSFIFHSDLIKEIDLPLACDFFGITHFSGKDEKTGEDKKTGEVKITLDLSMPVFDRHVLIIDDVLDTGFTINYLYRNILSRNPRSVKICYLISNPERQLANINIDFKAFELAGKAYLYGYGIDRKGYDRNLPYIAISNTKL